MNQPNVRASSAAKHRRAIAFGADQNFARFALFAIAQLYKLHPEPDFDICLCSEDVIDVPNSLSHLPIRLCQLDLSDILADAPIDDRINLASYLRLLLPTIFNEEYDRILYLDADMYFTGGDFSRLLSIDLAGRPVGAVRDKTQKRSPRRHPPEFKKLGLPTAPYFNAGLTLFDVPNWNALNLFDRCLSILRDHADDIQAHDQSVLNIAVYNNWTELSPTWNWEYSFATNYFIEVVDPNIVHFIVWRKPWSLLDGRIPQKYTEPYRLFMAEHFPDHAIARAAPISAAAKFHRKSLFKHWIDFNRITPYLDQFPDDFATISHGKTKQT